jgi:hypothetical protein
VLRFNSVRFFELVLLFVLMNSALPVLFPVIPLLIIILYVVDRHDRAEIAHSRRYNAAGNLTRAQPYSMTMQAMLTPVEEGR